MEKKGIQRIVGILVVIALMVVVMPLVFGKSETVKEEASNTQVPIPNQRLETNATSSQSQVATAENTNTNQNQPAVPPQSTTDVKLPEPVVLADASSATSNNNTETPMPGTQDAISPTNLAKSSVDITPEIAKQVNGEATSAETKPVQPKSPGNVVYDSVPAATHTITPIPNTVALQPKMPKNNAAASTNMKIKPAPTMNKGRKRKARVSTVAHRTVKNHHTMHTAKNLKSPAWVVQVGNFKVKENAVRLANKLRAAGYKAFMRDIKSAKGKTSVRVYIGPEFQQASAMKLSRNIRHNLNMQGFVIPYKPLEI